jgi:probable FeS assembly SUF system protein SufT
MIRGNLVRIEGVDADAIGKIPEVQPWLEETQSDGRVNEKAVWEAMKTCYDPEIPVNVVDLGLIYSCEISDDDNGGSLVAVKMTLTAPGCGMGDMIATEVKQKIEGVPGASEAKVELVWDPPWDRDMINESARLQLGML